MSRPNRRARLPSHRTRLAVAARGSLIRGTVRVVPPPVHTRLTPRSRPSERGRCTNALDPGLFVRGPTVELGPTKIRLKSNTAVLFVPSYHRNPVLHSHPTIAQHSRWHKPLDGRLTWASVASQKANTPLIGLPFRDGRYWARASARTPRGTKRGSWGLLYYLRWASTDSREDQCRNRLRARLLLIPSTRTESGDPAGPIGTAQTVLLKKPTKAYCCDFWSPPATGVPRATALDTWAYSGAP